MEIHCLIKFVRNFCIILVDIQCIMEFQKEFMDDEMKGRFKLEQNKNFIFTLFAKIITANLREIVDIWKVKA